MGTCLSQVFSSAPASSYKILLSLRSLPPNQSGKSAILFFTLLSQARRMGDVRNPARDLSAMKNRRDAYEWQMEGEKSMTV